jgi:hypothetical protein
MGHMQSAPEATIVVRSDHRVVKVVLERLRAKWVDGEAELGPLLFKEEEEVRQVRLWVGAHVSCCSNDGDVGACLSVGQREKSKQLCIVQYPVPVFGSQSV